MQSRIAKHILSLVLIFCVVEAHEETVEVKTHDCEPDTSPSVCTIKEVTLDGPSEFKPSLTNSDEITRITIVTSQFINFTSSGLNFKNLRGIDIIDCKGMNTMDEDFFDSSLSNMLTKLVINRSDLAFIDKEDFANLRSLTNILLSNNEVKSIHGNAFENLRKVTDIDFSFNQLTWLHEDTFKSCKTLHNLNLSNNAFTSISFSLFSRHSEELKKLYLENNSLTAINTTGVTSLIYLSELKLVGNVCINKSFTFKSSAEIENPINKYFVLCTRNLLVLNNVNATVLSFLEKRNKEIIDSGEKIRNKIGEEIEIARSELSRVISKINDMKSELDGFEWRLEDEQAQKMDKFKTEIRKELRNMKNLNRETSTVSTTLILKNNSDEAISAQLLETPTSTVLMISAIMSSFAVLITLAIVYVAYRMTLKASINSIV